MKSDGFCLNISFSTILCRVKMTDQKTIQESSYKASDMKTQEPASKGDGRPLLLLVEDDPLIDKMYTAKFTKEGFSVLVAKDGVEGLKLALEKVPDFIILDIMMPRLSGTDLLEKLRLDPKGKDIPVVILTNLSEKEEEEKAQRLGVKEYILKANITPSEIVAKIKKHLGR